MLGLGSSVSKSGKAGPTIIRDGLVLKHDYNAGAVEPVSSGAASFNGTSDYIAINAKPVDTADGTYCFWANSSETGSNAAYFAHGGSAVGEFTGNFSGTGKPLLYLKSDLYQYWVDTGFADDGKWHHWALIVDVDDMTACKLYIDGVEIAQDPGGRNTSGTVTNYGNLEIGRKDTSNEFEGYLCNFGVWNVHLTQAQVKSIMHKDYAALSASEKTNLVSWWNLDSTADVSTAEGGSNLTNVVLDKEGVLGGELGVNGDFSVSGAVTATSFSLGWATASGDDANDVSIANSRLTLSTLNDTPDDSTARAYLTNGSSNTNPLVVGQVYKLTFDIVDVSSNTPTLRVYHKNADYEVISSSVGSYSYYIRNTSNTLFLFQLQTDNSHVSISNLSIKPLSGNHGTLS